MTSSQDKMSKCLLAPALVSFCPRDNDVSDLASLLEPEDESFPRLPAAEPGAPRLVPPGLVDVEHGTAALPRHPAEEERGYPHVVLELEPVALPRPDHVGPQVVLLRLAVDDEALAVGQQVEYLDPYGRAQVDVGAGAGRVCGSP